MVTSRPISIDRYDIDRDSRFANRDIRYLISGISLALILGPIIYTCWYMMSVQTAAVSRSRSTSHVVMDGESLWMGNIVMDGESLYRWGIFLVAIIIIYI